MNKWYLTDGKESDVVLSTRVRLARNLKEYPFPNRLDEKGKREVDTRVREAMFSLGGIRDDEYRYIDMETLTPSQAISLAERHAVSPEFASDRTGRALILNQDETVSLMICEEDHLRLQVVHSGLDLEGAYDTADKLDTALDGKLGFAFDEELGYLTACPTNIGTGMRASVMLHLPALTRGGQIGRLSATVSKLGLTIRGAYGEGSSPLGDFYQLSNQVTLGISERAAIENLKSITVQVISQERTAREALRGDLEFEDRVWRAYGTLKNARLLSGKEFVNQLSAIRLGASMGILPTSMTIADDLLFSMQAATINASQGRELSPRERDILRAKCVREQL